MADAVLIVQRTSCGEYRTIAAQLPSKELNAIAAAALSALVESGANIADVLVALQHVELHSVERDIPRPILLTGGRG